MKMSNRRRVVLCLRSEFPVTRRLDIFIVIYEAHEVRKQNYDVFKIEGLFFIFFISLLGNFLKNGPLFTTNDSMMDADGWHHQVCAPRVLLGRGTGANLACRRDWLVLARQLLKCQYPSIFTL